MKTINANTKRAKKFNNAYELSDMVSIYECYENPSQAKKIAEMQCRATMIDTGGHDFRILGYNSMQFTCGWTTAEGNIKVETAQNTYLIQY